MHRSLWLALWLALLPTWVLLPSFATDRVLLPMHPASLAPLSAEDPERSSRLLLESNSLAADALFPMLADLRSMRAALANSVLPLWEPRYGAGMPLAGGSLYSPWYPLHWPALALGARGLVIGAALQLFLAGIGFWLFLRSRGLAVLPVALGALAYQAAGFALINLHYGIKVEAALWLPWGLWAIQGLGQGRRRAAPLLALAVGLSLGAGCPPIGIFVCLALLAALLWNSLAPGGRRSALPQGLLAMGVGLALAAVSLLPMAESHAQSTRDAPALAEIEAGALPRAALATLLLPDLFGNPSESYRAPQNPVAWWLCDVLEADKVRVANAREWNMHAGLAVLLLAFVGMILRPRECLLPGLALLFVLGYGLGWPPWSWLYGLSGLHLGAPAQVLSLAWLIWPWLAVLGLRAIHGQPHRASALLVLFAMGAIGIGLGLAQIKPLTLVPHMEERLAERHNVSVEEVQSLVPRDLALRAAEDMRRQGNVLALQGGALILCALASLLAMRRDRKTLALLPWALFMFCEGAALGRSHSTGLATEGALFPTSPAMEAVRTTTGDGRLLRFEPRATDVLAGLDLARPNLPTAYGIRDLTPSVAFPARRLTELLLALDPATDLRGGIPCLSDPALLDHPLLDRLQVRCILSRAPIAHAGLDLRYAAEGFHVYARSGSEDLLASAAVLPAAREARAAESLEWLSSRTATDAGVLLVESATPAPGVVAADWHPGQVTVYRPTVLRLDVAVRAGSGGWLLMREAWYPGWKATVNGEDAEVLPANHLYRAVRLPAGDVVVRTWYEPASLRWGAALSLLALGLILWGTLRPPSPPSLG